MKLLLNFLGLVVLALAGFWVYSQFSTSGFLLKTSQPREVLVYFNKVEENDIIQQAVTREVAPADDAMTQAIKELLIGPTEEEKAQGLSTALNEGTELNYIRVENGTATLDFNDRFDFQMGGSARVLALRQQIEKTLKQFPEITTIKLTINQGEREAVLEP